MAQTKSTTVVKNIVLVHGGFVDGSGWEGVYNVLKKDGYTVTIVQNPTISLTDDVAWLSAARQGEIPCVFRRRCEPGRSRIHGRLASAVGCERAGSHHQRSGMEGETQLVPANNRG